MSYLITTKLKSFYTGLLMLSFKVQHIEIRFQRGCVLNQSSSVQSLHFRLRIRRLFIKRRCMFPIFIFWVFNDLNNNLCIFVYITVSLNLLLNHFYPIIYLCHVQFEYLANLINVRKSYFYIRRTFLFS